MARNKIQFQKGLSERQFRASYGTEEQCRAALAAGGVGLKVSSARAAPAGDAARSRSASSTSAAPAAIRFP